MISSAVHINPSAAMTASVIGGSQLNNEALRLEREGDLAGAERLHLEAIEVKEEGLGVDHFTTAVSYNGLGELYLKANKLDKAEEYLNKALYARERSGPRADLAVTRDNLAKLFEKKGDLEAAGRIRRDGAPDNIACGNYDVSVLMASSLSRRASTTYLAVKCPKLSNALSNLSQCTICKVCASNVHHTNTNTLTYIGYFLLFSPVPGMHLCGREPNRGLLA